MSIESYLCYTDEWLNKAKRLHLDKDEDFAFLGSTEDSRIKFSLQLLNGIIEVSVGFDVKVEDDTSVSYLIFNDSDASSYPLAGGEIVSSILGIDGSTYYNMAVAQAHFDRGELLMLITVGSDHFYLRISDCLPYVDLDQDKYSGDHQWSFSL